MRDGACTMRAQNDPERERLLIQLGFSGTVAVEQHLFRYSGGGGVV